MQHYISTALCAITLVLSAAMSPGCSHRKDGTDISIINLKGELMHTDTAYVGAIPIILQDSILIMKAHSLSSLLYAAIIKGDSLASVGELFSRGQGPMEFSRPVIALGCDSSLMALNINAGGDVQSLTKVPLQSKLLHDSCSHAWTRQAVLMSGMYGIDSFVALSDSTVLVPTASFTDSRIFSILNLKSNDVYPVEYWPADRHEGPSLPKLAVYSDNSRIFKNNTNDRFLYKCGEERYAFIFSIENDTAHVVNEIFSEKPEYITSSDRMNYDLKRHGNGIYIAANGNHIYALLTKAEKQDKKAGMKIPIYGNQVAVFDWDGNLWHVLNLDTTAYAIAIDNTDNYLYAFSDNDGALEGEQVWRYKLK